MSGQIQPSELTEALSNFGYENHEEAIHRQFQPGKRVHFPARGKPASNKSASVYIYPDGAGAYLRDFVNDIEEPIWPKQTGYLSPEQIEQRRQQAQDAKRKADAELQILHDRVARTARAVYRGGERAGTHQYIEDKKLSGLHNALIDPRTGNLVVPMWRSDVGLVNVQFISASGKKRFLKGGRTKDCYTVIGSLDGATEADVVEGWSTGVTRHEMHGKPVVVAFSAGNLMSVCQTLRSKFLDLNITLCGDDDRQTKGNPGRTKATAAAEAIGAAVLFPELCKCCTCTDFSDVSLCGRRQR